MVHHPCVRERVVVTGLMATFFVPGAQQNRAQRQYLGNIVNILVTNGP